MEELSESVGAIDILSDLRDANLLKYTGAQDNLTEPYIPTDELIEAVNIAIALGRPLLIKGEPGCGKTKLAQAVAEELQLVFFPFYVKSTSQAQELRYTYDTVARLRDAQLAAAGQLTEEELDASKKERTYISWGVLGDAFRDHERRSVILIDEIDKADIDFPNDLLNELDQLHFPVLELKLDKVEANPELKPIIFVTSNDEKELPNAFLRRCVFFYIDFPPGDKLRQIVSRHVAGHIEQTEDERFKQFVKEVVTRFGSLREKMVAEHRYGGKRVSTSELIDWARALKQLYVDQDKELPPETSELLLPSVLLKGLPDMISYSGREP
jgi:MoxR-like ATPase